MSSLRSFDVFAKPLEGTRTRTAAGGIITVLSYGAAGLLLVAQLYLYVRGEVRHSLHLADSSSSPVLARPYGEPIHSRKTPGNAKANSLFEMMHNQALNRIPLTIRVTFPHIKCRNLDYAHDNAAKSDGKFAKVHGRNALQMSSPSRAELSAATGQPAYAPQRFNANDGCTVKGTIFVPRVGGSLSVTVSRRAWQEATNIFNFAAMDVRGEGGGRKDDPAMHRLPNCTHYIHEMTFGEPFPLSSNPLEGALHVIDNDSGVALNSVAVKLVPTVYSRGLFLSLARQTYQASVAAHVVQPQTLAAQRSVMLPGLMVSYDFTPLAVHHVEGRDNIFVFLGSLVSIVGGVFVTVGLVTGCLFNSAAAVAKKMD
mmetsp:Transcript_6998/g.20971  ORF Transcript_6998/g.20971 Transcript_6998/m.20971 type:complete len:369 (-) Transcript_6998:508-1614(-)|eukprot:CAMPEP_0113543648 /NCGR_PEP_ID=MMETSP0015_2-20120614/10271_1 /TAXON_ID=2838 /ORGANISM="Odontella" /LENGTH=368 /DNA_ID=CAMNT_0000443823 /DNA_START=50 /DNA_END=1156 /DNA_ORIENTATION=- /assembly_acc=CAM_ASM_000160